MRPSPPPHAAPLAFVLLVVATSVGAQDFPEAVGFRFAYRRSPGSRFAPFGGYSGQRYLLVAKADGSNALRDVPVLRYLELGVGDQARGFDPAGERGRELALSPAGRQCVRRPHAVDPRPARGRKGVRPAAIFHRGRVPPLAGLTRRSPRFSAPAAT